MKLTVRASETRQLMTSGDKITATTLTWLKEKAVAQVLGITTFVATKQMTKGLDCEQASIDLLNAVMFEDFKKNSDRIEKNGFTGSWDIRKDNVIRDIKTSWSASTFPFFQDDAEQAVKKSGYDWQMRVYMMLTGADVAFVDYCLITTPEELLTDWDDWELHHVDHIPITKRVTSVRIERDLEIEQKMLDKYELANTLYQGFIHELNKK